MGIIEDIRVPYSDEPNCVDYCNQTMAYLKELYDQLMNAKHETISYILAYERAEESTNFSIKQYQEALGKMQNKTGGTDPNREKIIKTMQSNIEELNSLLGLITTKLSDFDTVSKGLDNKISELIDKNNEINAVLNSASLMHMPPSTY